nr:TPA_exp: dioxygenase [uncultured Gammaproteobacteria bacterium]
MTDHRKELEDNGYTILRSFLPASFVEEVTGLCNGVIDGLGQEHWELFRSQGSRPDIGDIPAFANIIAHDSIKSVFQRLNFDFDEAAYNSGAIFARPPGGPPLFWHQDWWGWNDPISYRSGIPQVNVMIYQNTTSPKNGCLRVIPGSHKRGHPIHDIEVEYDVDLCKVVDPDHPIYGSWRDEVPVCVDVGDVVVSDTRLLHSAYPNQSRSRRVMLSLSYHPDFSARTRQSPHSLLFGNRHGAD